MRKLKHFAVFLCLLVCLSAQAGQVTGLIQSAGGQNLSNATLTWTPTQFAVVAGSFVQTAQSVNCYTDANGNVVGLPNPLVTAIASPAGGGFLSSGTTYYIQYTITGTPGETAPSPELAFFLPGGSTTINITAPVLQPVGAAGYKVYASTTPGGEKLQATVSGFGNTSFSTLAVGASVPSSNNTTCNFNFSDSLIPQARYVLAITDSSGSPVPGWPQTYYTQGATFNLNTAVPTNGTTAIFQNAIVSTPSGGATQSIFSNLNLNGFNLSDVGTLSANEYTNLFYICPLLDPFGLTDSSSLLQNCYNLAYPKGEETIIPNGKFLINTPLNFTNKPGAKIGGVSSQYQISSEAPISGAGESILLCNTGAVCVDTTGSGDTQLKDFSIYLAGTGITTPSTVGILLARDNAAGGGTGAFCFQSKYVIDNVNIVDYSNNTTGRGYIGIANIGAENGTYKNFGIHTASPLVFGATNFIPLTSPYQTIATGAACPGFMTQVTMNNLILDSFTAVRPNIEASGSYSVHGDDMQFIGGNAAILFEGAATGNWDITGAQESLIAPGYFIRSTVNVTDSRFHIESAPTAYINPEANNLTFKGNDFLFNTDFGASPLITDTATGTSIAGGRATVSSATSAANTTVSGTAIFSTVAHTSVTFNAASNYFLAASDGNFAIGDFKVTTIRQIDASTDFQIKDAGGNYHFDIAPGGVNTFLAGSGSGKVFIGKNSHISGGDTGAFIIGDGIGGTGKTIVQEASVSTGSIGATTRTEVLLTWGTTMGDTNYKVQCNVQDSTTAAGTQGLTFERIRTLSATQVGAVINNPTAGGITGTVYCTGTHP